ncbi:hypothetical protein KKC65_02185 [Patescibacteria group bacterium]|nr:hypothetical protein [Patescibacteria group bacterium]
MKPEEALKKLKSLVHKTNVKNHIDLEESHIKADGILVDLIKELLQEKEQRILGEKIAKSFDEINKWYA